MKTWSDNIKVSTRLSSDKSENRIAGMLFQTARRRLIGYSSSVAPLGNDDVVFRVPFSSVSPHRHSPHARQASLLNADTAATANRTMSFDRACAAGHNIRCAVWSVVDGRSLAATGRQPVITPDTSTAAPTDKSLCSPRPVLLLRCSRRTVTV